jgi:hypothetical protein
MTSQRWLLSSLAAVGMVAMLSAQTPKPTFEAVTIKKAEQKPLFSLLTPEPATTGPFMLKTGTVSDLIQQAYGVKAPQIIGGPDWTRTEKFSIAASTKTVVPLSELSLMMQSLLEDRFKLVVRREQRALEPTSGPVDVIVIDSVQQPTVD